jgi:CheY-specific phosphatase CheX
MQTFFDQLVYKGFMEGVQHSIGAYLGEPLGSLKASVAVNTENPYAVGGMLRFQCADVDASMILVFEKEFALKLYSNMIGEAPANIDGDVEDCVCELTNIIYGYAKANLTKVGYKFSMARPEIVRDLKSVLANQVRLEMPFRFMIAEHKQLALMFVVHKHTPIEAVA